MDGPDDGQSWFVTSWFVVCHSKYPSFEKPPFESKISKIILVFSQAEGHEKAKIGIRRNLPTKRSGLPEGKRYSLFEKARPTDTKDTNFLLLRNLETKLGNVFVFLPVLKKDGPNSEFCSRCQNPN